MPAAPTRAAAYTRTRILARFIELLTQTDPGRVDRAYVEQRLHLKGGDVRAFLQSLRVLGLTDTYGRTTDRARRVRGPSQRAAALSEGLRDAYPELVARWARQGSMARDAVEEFFRVEYGLSASTAGPASKLFTDLMRDYGDDTQASVGGESRQVGDAPAQHPKNEPCPAGYSDNPSADAPEFAGFVEWSDNSALQVTDNPSLSPADSVSRDSRQAMSVQDRAGPRDDLAPTHRHSPPPDPHTHENQTERQTQSPVERDRTESGVRSPGDGQEVVTGAASDTDSGVRGPAAPVDARRRSADTLGEPGAGEHHRPGRDGRTETGVGNTSGVGTWVEIGPSWSPPPGRVLAPNSPGTPASDPDRRDPEEAGAARRHGSRREGSPEPEEAAPDADREAGPGTTSVAVRVAALEMLRDALEIRVDAEWDERRIALVFDRLERLVEKVLAASL